MKTVYLLVTKTSGQNDLYRIEWERPAALRRAHAEVKRLKVESGYAMPDRKTYGLAVIFRASTLEAPDGRFAVVEIYPMPVHR